MLLVQKIESKINNIQSAPITHGSEVEQTRELHIMEVESIILCFLKSEVCYSEQAMLLLMAFVFPNFPTFSTFQLQHSLKENTDKKNSIVHVTACSMQGEETLWNQKGTTPKRSLQMMRKLK